MLSSILPILIVVGIVVLIVGVVQLLLMYRKAGDGRYAPKVDGDRVYGDDRLNEMLYARSSDEEEVDAEFGADGQEAAQTEFGADGEEAARTGGTDAIACPNCGTENDPRYEFCRVCASDLPE